MKTGKAILMTLERVENGVMFELARECEPTGIPGIGVKVGQYFVHSAELGVEHSLELDVVEFRENALGPRSEFDLELEGEAIGRVAIGVAEAGIIFVQDVPRRPEAVEVEPAGADVAFGDLGESFFAIGKSAEVSIALRILNDFQF
jgi:hypothetical protein